MRRTFGTARSPALTPPVGFRAVLPPPAGLRSTPLLVACALLAPVLLYAQTPPRDTLESIGLHAPGHDAARGCRHRHHPPRERTRHSRHRRPADPAEPAHRGEGRARPKPTLQSVENAQINVLSGCRGGFIPGFDAKAAIKAAGTIGRVKVNIDYDMQREFDASNSFSLSYEGKPGRTSSASTSATSPSLPRRRAS